MINCHYEIVIVSSLRHVENNIRDVYMDFKVRILNHDLDSSD